MSTETYQVAPPPIYKSDNCCDCTCGCLRLECVKKQIDDTTIIRAIALYCIILGVIGITLTCLDPVPDLTYTFPYSTGDTERHKWDCMHFQAFGLFFGILSLLFGIIMNKLSSKPISAATSLFLGYAIVSLIVMTIVIIVTTAVPARGHSVDDPDKSKDYAVTSEGYTLNSVSCGTYMYDHHKMGLFGSWVSTIGLIGPPVFVSFVWLVFLLLYVLSYGLYYLMYYVVYLFSCKSVCPEFNQSVEDKC